MSGETCAVCGRKDAALYAAVEGDRWRCGVCEIETLRARLAASEAELLAWAGPCVCGEINARHCPRHNETPEQREVAFAAVIEERNALRTRAEAAEAEVARLRGEYERGLREAAGVCDAYGKKWGGDRADMGWTADECRKRILALVDSKGGE